MHTKPHAGEALQSATRPLVRRHQGESTPSCCKVGGAEVLDYIDLDSSSTHVAVNGAELPAYSLYTYTAYRLQAYRQQCCTGAVYVLCTAALCMLAYHM